MTGGAPPGGAPDRLLPPVPGRPTPGRGVARLSTTRAPHPAHARAHDLRFRRGDEGRVEVTFPSRPCSAVTVRSPREERASIVLAVVLAGRAAAAVGGRGGADPRRHRVQPAQELRVDA